ncbi:hypothetical protein MLD38_038997 [Melastoma candidum]|uniref:Uncharacterized protein n=2 Tax=Melastoma candidum TaxID=119954 RepID=A0ACB9L1G0_9MYRT|nr:hypothetical protein MLD38_038997 [Melastoma candidum]
MEGSRGIPSPSEAAGSPAEDFGKLLESQKVLFDDQVDRLRDIVVTQCRLTGVNPLSQEMAAGALTIKIGKRPRDLLNPRAVKYMEDIFSIKDAISKKEFREISALFGVTVTQVRDFFASHRTQVRKFSRLSRERISRSAAVENPSDDVPTTSQSRVSSDPVPLNSIAPTDTGVESNFTAQENMFPGLDESEKKFVDNIFKLMSKEETFSGQLRLMDWIRQIQNPSVLSWFLTTGGIIIVATWLNQAASEEQIDVLSGFLEVLGNLPIDSVLRSHVAPIIQEVNRLRFYHVSDVSSRAQTLLAKWSKTLSKSQGIAKINGVKVSGKQNQGLLKSSSGQMVSMEPWHADVGLPEELLASSRDSPVPESGRKLEGPALKLLPASADDPSRKHILGASSSQNRKRRKVQLVEHPGQKLSSNRSPQPSKIVTISQSRPMSADDIQKAKMRAFHMQNKYRKGGLSNNEESDVKVEVTPETPQTAPLPSPPGGEVQPPVTELDNIAHPEDASKISQVQPTICEDNGVPSKSCPDYEVSISKRKGSNLMVNRKTPQIPWFIPAEVKFSEEWRVGGGEESKEVEVQRNRNKREKETFYKSHQEIPLNPKEPWDREMDYDDTLTPVIPIEQQPDADEVDPQSASSNGNGVGSTSAPSASVINPTEVEPDYELLAVLLQTPSLVFTLKDELEGRSMSQQTVRILDMIRAGEINIQGDLNSNGARSRRETETVPVSLPSPTPSSDPVLGRMGGSVTDASRNPFSRQRVSAEGIGYSTQGVSATGLAAAQPGSGGSSIPAPAQAPADAVLLQQLSANMQALAQLMQEGLVSSSSGLPYNPPNIVSHQLQHQHIGYSPDNGLLSNSSITHRSQELIQQPPPRNTSTPAASYHSLLTAPVDATERRNNAYSSVDYAQPKYLRQPQQPSLQSQQLYAPGSALVGNRREGFSSHHQESHHQVNQTSYGPYSAGNGMVQQQWRTSANPLERGGQYPRSQYDSWSPENSPSRNPEYRQAPRSAMERLYAGQERARQQASSGYPYHSGDYSGQQSKWQQDRRY